MSKGSKRRPSQVDRKTFDDNWDMIFGKKEKNIEVLDLHDFMDIFQEHIVSLDVYVHDALKKEAERSFVTLEIYLAKGFDDFEERHFHENSHELIKEMENDLDNFQNLSEGINPVYTILNIAQEFDIVLRVTAKEYNLDKEYLINILIAHGMRKGL